MRFQHSYVAGLAARLPEDSWSSAEIERRLAGLYRRLGLSEGRLELMSGIRARRVWPPGARPGPVAAAAGARALERSGVPRASIGLLVHASVCRDFLEPATASVVHRALELPASCQAYDLSNACLGFVNALALAAQSIDAGAVEAALIVAGEDGRPLLEATLARLAGDPAVGREDLKRAFASLTIGSGAAAAVVAHERLLGPAAERPPLRIAGALARVDSSAVELCRGDAADGGYLMETNSEALLAAGVALARRTWTEFLTDLGWEAQSVARVVSHQVGSAHRRALLEALDLGPERDFPTFAELGNAGSAALPIALDLALEAGAVRRGPRTALLGIGSGLQCQMLGLE
jgi:3-oxoacyl-[acyl-carrier-protein] synthase-3